MKLSEAPDDKLIASYIKIRDARAQRKAAYDVEDSEDKQKQDKLESEMIARLNSRGAKSISTNFGTAYKASRTSATVADWDAFFNNYVVPNQAWELLEHRASKAAVEQFRAANDDVPPGINWREEITVNFRRS